MGNTLSQFDKKPHYNQIHLHKMLRNWIWSIEIKSPTKKIDSSDIHVHKLQNKHAL